MRICCLATACLLVCAAHGALAAESLLPNGGFEQGTAGWNALWTREAGAGTAELGTANLHGGARCMRVTHRGAQDWSLNRADALSVTPGEVYQMRGWARVQGAGSTTMCVVLRDAAGQTVNWMYGARTLSAAPEWRELSARFVIPPGAASILPRFVGNGPAVVWMDDVGLTLEGKVNVLSAAGRAKAPVVENAALKVVLHPQDATFSVTDKRTGRTWTQLAMPAGPMVGDLEEDKSGFGVLLVQPETATGFSADMRLDGDLPELTVELRGEGPMPAPLRWPHPFATRAGEFLIMPVNEGISYPVDDAGAARDAATYLYGGHGLCMAWYGVTDGERRRDGHRRNAGRRRGPRRAGATACSRWRPSGSRRRASSARARGSATSSSTTAATWPWPSATASYAKQTGLLKTLAEKRKAEPERRSAGRRGQRLVLGAATPSAVCREHAGRRHRAHPLEQRRARPSRSPRLNDMGVLTSRYDIYQDVMDPANFPKLRGIHRDWTTDAWPKDLHARRRRRLDPRLGGRGQGRRAGTTAACSATGRRSTTPAAASPPT